MNSKQYFKKCYENVVNPVCSKVMLVYDLTQDLYMSILQSLWKHFIMVQPSALLTNIRIFKKNERNKHTSLFCRSVSNRLKSFIALTPCRERAPGAHREPIGENMD